MMKSICIHCAVLTVFMCACVYGPKTEQKKPLGYLNGENYETTPVGVDQVIVPIVKRHERLTKISGRATFAEGILEVPAKQLKIALISKNGTTLSEVSTDANGEFTFSDVIKNGTYRLECRSPKYQGSEEIEVKDYEVPGLLLRVRPIR